MAQSGHSSNTTQCPLLGAKRTWLPRRKMSANDPKRTLSLRSGVCHFSLAGPSQSARLAIAEAQGGRGINPRHKSKGKEVVGGDDEAGPITTGILGRGVINGQPNADLRESPPKVCFRTIPGKDGFRPSMVCPLMTQSGHSGTLSLDHLVGKSDNHTNKEAALRAALCIVRAIAQSSEPIEDASN